MHILAELLRKSSELFHKNEYVQFTYKNCCIWCKKSVKLMNFPGRASFRRSRKFCEIWDNFRVYFPLFYPFKFRCKHAISLLAMCWRISVFGKSGHFIYTYLMFLWGDSTMWYERVSVEHISAWILSLLMLNVRHIPVECE